MNSVQARVQTAVTIELRVIVQEVHAAGQVEQDNRLVAHGKLRILDQILMSVAPADVHKVSTAH